MSTFFPNRIQIKKSFNVPRLVRNHSLSLHNFRLQLCIVDPMQKQNVFVEVFYPHFHSSFHCEYKILSIFIVFCFPSIQRFIYIFLVLNRPIQRFGTWKTSFHLIGSLIGLTIGFCFVLVWFVFDKNQLKCGQNGEKKRSRTWMVCDDIMC